MSLSKSKELQKVCHTRMKEILEGKGLFYNAANTRERGKAFTEFYVTDILSPVASLDEEVVEQGMKCDGSGDLNIDFIYQDEKTFMIFQSKYIGVNSKNKLDSNSIARFFNMHSQIVDREFVNTYGNDYVRDFLSEVKKNSSFQYHLLTTDEISDKQRAEIEIAQKEAALRYEDQDISWEVIDAPRLREEYRRAKSIDVTFPEEVEIHIEKISDRISENSQKKWAYLDITELVGNEEHESMVCSIKGTNLQQLYKQYKETLFNYNIRGFLGANKINKNITETIREQPENFYYFNNGISAICQDMEVVNDSRSCKVVCKKFQIINGAQTVSTIGTYRGNVDDLAKVRVLLRITKGEKVSSDKGINREIIRFNNSQTSIKASDFKSNDNIQIYLQKEFKDQKVQQRSTTPYREVVYARKRSERMKKKSNDITVIDLTELARALCAFKVDPALTQSQTRLFSDSEKGLYPKLFGRDGEEIDFFTKEEFDEVGAVVLIWFFIKECLFQKNKELKNVDEVQELDELVVQSKWKFLFCFAEVIKSLYPNQEDRSAFYKKVLKGKYFNVNESNYEIFKKWYLEVYQTLRRELARARKEDSFNFRNWLRSTRVTKDLKDEFSNADWVKSRFGV